MLDCNGTVLLYCGNFSNYHVRLSQSKQLQHPCGGGFDGNLALRQLCVVTTCNCEGVELFEQRHRADIGSFDCSYSIADSTHPTVFGLNAVSCLGKSGCNSPLVGCSRCPLSYLFGRSCILGVLGPFLCLFICRWLFLAYRWLESSDFLTRRRHQAAGDGQGPES